MSPCAKRSTFFERCLATATKPISSNSCCSRAGSGEVNSTNSKPSVPSGLSKRSRVMALSPSEGDQAVRGDHFAGLDVGRPSSSR